MFNQAQTLDSLCEFINGGAWTEEEYVEEGLPVLKVSNFKDNQYSLDEVSFLSHESAKKYAKHQLSKNDLIIATVGSHPNLVNSAAGRTIRVNDDAIGYYLNQNAVYLKTKNSNILNQVYLAYLGQTEEFKNYIQVRGKGAASQMRIAIADIKSFPVKLIPIEAQEKIASILLSYDDLIENNLKRIKLLEEMAKTTYEEWFVRLKFPGYESAAVDKETGLPEGWTTRNLGHFIEHEIGGGWGEEEASKEFSELAYVIRGTDFDGLPTGNTQNVPLRWHKKSNLASRKLAPGDIIFEVSGGSQNEGVAKTVLMTEELLSLFNEDVMCASFCKLARPISTEIGHYLFYFLRFLRKIKASEVFEIRSASNIVNYNWTAFLKFQEVNLPSESLLDEFHTFSENSTKQISVLAKQVKRLKEARDILLPRLMTGMIDIEQVELPKAMLKRLEEQEDKMAIA